jgi:hypothetical protein
MFIFTSPPPCLQGRHALDEARLEHLSRAVYRLGEWALFEFFAETLRQPQAEFVDHHARYTGISLDAFRDAGGDRIAPRLFAVGGDR